MNITFQRSRTKALILTFLCFGIFCLSLWLLLAFETEVFPKQMIIAGVSFVAAALILPTWMKQAFSRTPAIELHKEGIKINVGPQSPTAILWENVAGVNLTKKSSVGLLRITDSSGPEVLITSAMVKGELSEVANEIEKFRAEHGS